MSLCKNCGCEQPCECRMCADCLEMTTEPIEYMGDDICPGCVVANVPQEDWPKWLQREAVHPNA